MRLNVFIAQQTGISRRAADRLIEKGYVLINDEPVELGQQLEIDDTVVIKSPTLHASFSYSGEVPHFDTYLFNKPIGYVCSRTGQGSKTIYDILPDELHHLKPVGRLDKNSSGLLVLTNDGQLANQLTHPSNRKVKVYHITLDKPLQPLHHQIINDIGITLEDGPSRLQLEKLHDDPSQFEVSMHEGRNRQIRRTFASLGYKVTKLHRIIFGPYRLDDLKEGQLRET